MLTDHTCQGYAPGSWSQVAVERTKPTGRVVGIDIIPAQPPKGVATIQGNFLSPGVQGLVKQFLLDTARRKAPTASRDGPPSSASPASSSDRSGEADDATAAQPDDEDVVEDRPSYIDMERQASLGLTDADEADDSAGKQDGRRSVDVSWPPYTLAAESEAGD
jgi:21S rRNA (uridine2791-2'-O)-methyltransferase